MVPSGQTQTDGEAALEDGDGSSPCARYRYTLEGVVDGARAGQLLSEVRGIVLDGAATVLLDLRRLERCEPQARSLLVEAQKQLAGYSSRTAWLVSRPITHGLAMWVINLSGDGGARAVTSMSQAAEWLEAVEDRGEANAELLLGAVAGVRTWRSI